MIHKNVSTEKLAVIRFLLFSALAIYAFAVPGERLALLPPELHRPIGFAKYLPLTDSYLAILGLRSCAGMLLAGAALGIRYYRCFALAGLTLFTAYAAILQAGHRELGAIYLGYALAIAPAARVWSVHPAPDRSDWSPPPSLTLQVATFVFLLTYSMIGTERLLYSAPRIFLDDSIIWHLASNSDRNGTFGFSFGYALLEWFPASRSALALGFFTATYLEALAPLALFWSGFRRILLVFVIGFHLTNLLLLNIEFTLNTLVALLLLPDWTPPRTWSVHKAEADWHFAKR